LLNWKELGNKKGRVLVDAPWTNNLWQLRWLGFHCRQKGRTQSPNNLYSWLVAGQQHGVYEQFIHNLKWSPWTICAWTVDRRWGVDWKWIIGL